jgi:uncharacterized protein YlzI (FlbEa/FlbD family)
VNELQTKEIVWELINIAELSTNLQDLLRAINDSKFLERLAHGEDMKMQLNELNGNIFKAKVNLMLKIETAHVGLTLVNGQSYAVQIEQLNRVESQLKQLMQNFGCLEISELITERDAGMCPHYKAVVMHTLTE